MARHIKHDALADQRKKIATTWVWVYDSKTLLGYISLAMFSIDRKNFPVEEQNKYPYSIVPSLLVGQIATHRDYRGCGIGSSMMYWAFGKAYEYSLKLGCRTVALHPLPDAVDWYRKKFHFRSIDRGAKPPLMYFDLLLRQ